MRGPRQSAESRDGHTTIIIKSGKRAIRSRGHFVDRGLASAVVMVGVAGVDERRGIDSAVELNL